MFLIYKKKILKKINNGFSLFNSLWRKIFLIFTLLIFLSSFLTVGITSWQIRCRFDQEIASQDQQTANVLARRISQIISIKPSIDFSIEKNIFTFLPKDKPCKKIKKDPHSYEGDEERKGRGLKRKWYFDKLNKLHQNYVGEKVEIVLPILIDSYPFLFSPRPMHDGEGFSIAPYYKYKSINGKLLYQSRRCGFFETKGRNWVPILIDKREVGSLFVTSQIGEKRHQSDSLFLKTLMLTVGLAALISLFVAAIIAFIIIRKMIAPLHQLKEGAEKVSRGDFSFTINAKGKDEIAQLSIAFNQMALQLVALENSRKQMISDISHELRTPVALLKGRLEMIQMGNYEPTTSNWEKMEKDLVHLSNLINQIHDLSVLDQSSNFDLNEFKAVESVLKDIYIDFEQQASTQKIKMTLFIEPGLESMNISPHWGRRVIQNLLSNALTYTPEGGIIEISLLKSQKIPSSILLKVADSGFGVENALLEKIFERFYRVDDSRSKDSGGSGIGLALVKAWVESIGGNVFAVNNEWGGLTIEIYLKENK